MNIISAVHDDYSNVQYITFPLTATLFAMSSQYQNKLLEIRQHFGLAPKAISDLLGFDIKPILYGSEDEGLLTEQEARLTWLHKIATTWKDIRPCAYSPRYTLFNMRMASEETFFDALKAMDTFQDASLWIEEFREQVQNEHVRLLNAATRNENKTTTQHISCMPFGKSVFIETPDENC